MRLICSEYGIDLEIQENRVNILVVESPNVFSSIIDELICQMKGEPGTFILSEQDVIKVISKEAELIVNPFGVDCNEKRVQLKLYQELANEMSESMIEETIHLQGQMISYLDTLLQKAPYPLEYDIEENMTGFLKWCRVGIDNQGETMAERLMNYIKILSCFCNIKIMFFVNLKSYLSQFELEEIYKCGFYTKINMILLENVQKEKLENESICILDKDLCIINVE